MSRGNRGLSIAQLMVGVALVATSCAKTDDGSVAGRAALPLPMKVNPRALEMASPAEGVVSLPGEAEPAWEAFDRDTTTRFTPRLDAEGRLTLRVSFGEPSSLTHVKVFGPSPYRLEVLASGAPLKGLESLDLSRLAAGWNLLSVSELGTASDRVELRLTKLEAAAGVAGAALGDIELWGVGHGLPQRVTRQLIEQKLDHGEGASLPFLDEVGASPSSGELTGIQGATEAACVSFSFSLSRPPALYRSAWLGYRLEGAFRPFALTRTLNGRTEKLGHWSKASEGGARVYVEPLDPEQLRLEHNQYGFCLPKEAIGQVRVRDLRFFGELEHGGNLAQSAAFGPADGVPTRTATDLFEPGAETRSFDAGERLVVAFERWVSPDAVIAGSNGEGWVVQCLDDKGVAREVETELLSAEGGLQLLLLKRAAEERVCAGLALQPRSASAKISYLAVLGSGAQRRVDWPGIRLASSPEHFGLKGWVDGWASAPAALGGAVRVDVEGEEAGAANGVFARLLERTGDPATAWPLAVTARFRDGSSFTQRFVLEPSGEAVPELGVGVAGAGVASEEDGLTAEERQQRYASVGESVTVAVTGRDGASIRLGTHVGVDVPANALADVGESINVSVAQLGKNELPALDPGLVNVTAPSGRGYEFLPHGQKFTTAVRVQLPYQKNLLPRGYSPADVLTYFFDEEARRWRELTRENVDETGAIVTSLTDHFTVMINAIVVAPEHPQVAGFNPTELRELEAADPSAQVNVIDPPQPIAKGDAVLTYPLETPPGRGGLDPELALVYNSSVPNGWLGVGWDLPRRTLTIDTRWGVPRYDPTDETETYALEGVQLAPFAHRGPIRKRNEGTTDVGGEAVKIFSTRIESKFQKIIRHGSSPSTYWWEVIDKLGVRHFYGATPESPTPNPNATLGVEDGPRPGVFEWALKEIRDTNGNSIRFFYDRVRYPEVEVPGRVVSGTELYPSRIEYTLEAGDSSGPYEVAFLRGSPRPDVIVDGRGGFKRTTAELLRRAEVRFAGRVVRAWEFGYRAGAFHKSLLETIRQFGADDAAFPGNLHTFEYFDSITSGANYSGYGARRAFTSQSDDVSASLGAPLDVFGDGQASGLSGVEGTTIGGHLYLGFNPSGPTKPNSFGFKIGFGSSSSNGLLSLLDIDGDGLPDKVWRQGNRVFYRRNLSGPSGPAEFAAEAREASGISAIFREQATMFSAGAEAYPGIASLIYNHAETFTSSDTYFSDVNGDGLLDLVSGSSVRFNRRNADGTHGFVANDASGTPFPIVPGTIDATDLLPDYTAVREENERRFPLADSVRVWEAPFSGSIDIVAAVKLSRVKTAAEVIEQGFDGVRVAIERIRPSDDTSGSELWSTAIEPTDGTLKTPDGVNDLSVVAGDRLYFRVQSRENGVDDEVDWDPSITYDDIAADTFDANGLDVSRYRASEDFVLAGRLVTREVPFEGVLRVSGALTKSATTDDVELQVLKNDAVVISLPLGATSQQTVVLDETLGVVPEDSLEVRVRADSPIDVRALHFDPPIRISYDSAQDANGVPVPLVDGHGNPIFQVALPVDVDLYPRQMSGSSVPATNPLRPLAPYVVENCSRLAAFAAAALPVFDPTPSGEPLVLTVKKGSGSAGVAGSLLSKHVFATSDAISFELSGLAPDDRLFFEFSGRDPDLIGSFVGVELVCVEAYDPNQPAEPSSPVLPPSMVRAAASENRCSEPYRGWAYGGYNGQGTRGTQPISEFFCRLDSGSGLDDDTDVPSDAGTIDNESGVFGSFRDHEDITFVFAPFPEGRDCQRAQGDDTPCPAPAAALWGGPDDRTYVTSARISSSRIGPDDISVPSPEDVLATGAGPGGISIPVVHRLGRSSENSLGGGIGFGILDFGGAHAEGPSSSELDYMDMNGDGFPDVVSSRSGIQYTDSRGTLGATGLRGSLGGDLRRSDMVANTLGLGGTVPTFPGDAEGNGTGTGSEPNETGGSKPQLQPLGLSLSESVGSARTQSDLIDVNGDGLPDRVRRVGSGAALEIQVELSLGYRFAPPEVWAGSAPTVAVSDGNSQQVGAGVTLGFNSGHYAFAGGISLTRSSSAIRESPESDIAPLGELTQDRGTTLADVNGDGLVDVVRPDAGALRVAINRGADFAPFANWGGVPEDLARSDVSLSRNTSLGGGIYFTIGIPLFPCPCSIIINPGVDASASMSRQEIQIADVDGDGYPDYLTSDRDSEVRAALNNTGKTNLLKRVSRPLGAVFALDYARKGNSFEHPQSRWVLSEVRLTDGVLGDGPDTEFKTFQYDAGRYDRLEREFYGFATEIEEERDTRVTGEPVYRRTTRTFHNQNLFSQGLLQRELIEGVVGGTALPFSDTVNTYVLRDVVTRAELAAASTHDDPGVRAVLGSVFPELRVILRQQHEGAPAEFVATSVEQEFDAFGNITRLLDTGDPADNDTMLAVLTYTGASGRHAACAAGHIVGLADLIQVSGSSGVLRQREADYDCSGGTGDLLELREAIGSGVAAATTFAYEPNGNLRQVTGPLNLHNQRYALDISYDTVVKTHVTGVTDSYGHASSADYDLRFGERTLQIDSNGQPLSRAFDVFGRLESVTGPYEQGSGHPTIRFEYFSDRVPAVAITRHHDPFRDPSGGDTIDTITFIDGLARVIQAKKDATLHQAPGQSPLDQMIVSGRVLFDHLGRTIEARYPTVEAKNLTTNLAFNPAVDSVPATRTSYDFVDRVTGSVLPDDSVTSHAYLIAPDKTGAARLAAVTTDAELNTRAVFRDIREQIRAVREDNRTKSQEIWTLYAYDAVQQLRAIQDDRGNVTSQDYDLLGRRTRIDNPDMGRTDLAYDAASNLVRKTTSNLRALGTSIEYDYHFTRLIQILYPSFPENNVSYSYGAPGLLGDGTNRVGRIARVTDEGGSEDRKYGRLGELAEETKTVASDTQGQSGNSPEIWTTRYLYDTWGRLQQMTYPDGEVLTYRYDSGGMPRQAEGVKLEVTFPYLEKLEYDKFEQRVFMLTGNGIPTTYEYEPRNRRLSRLQAATFQDLRYGYDRVGNVRSLSNDVEPVAPPEMGGPVDQSFTYDALYRLTSASGQWHFAPNKTAQYSLAMDYDTVHNILQKQQNHDVVTPGGATIEQKDTTYDFDYAYAASHPHAPSTIGTRDYGYDANGNQIRWDEQRSGQRRTIVWDEENRVQSISDNGRTTSYKYDDSGERVIKRGEQGETAYVNQFWTVRNRSVGTKHVFVGDTRLVSKLSPGEAHVNPSGGGNNANSDLLLGMVGNWLAHRSQSGSENGQNVNQNPHITGCVPPRCSSVMPSSEGLPDANFVYFYHPDHLGSTNYVTDKDGELFQHLQYFPFGETWVEEHSNTERMPYLFTSKEFDEETELYYFGARYFDPRTSVWQSADPMLEKYLPSVDSDEEELPGLGGAYNPLNLALYAYGHQRPLRFADPNGEEVTVKVTGNQVEIKITAQLSGPRATKATAQWYKSSVEKEFSGKFGKYNVKTEVDVQLAGTTDASRHQVVLNDETKPSSAEIGGSKATIRFNKRPEARMRKVMPHETGHLLGLADEYKTTKDPKTGARKTAPLKGKEKSLMASTASDAKITQEHIGKVIKNSQGGKLNQGIKKSKK